jgi:LmbE family N-acetylglucosaminyl deacetylase
MQREQKGVGIMGKLTNRAARSARLSVALTPEMYDRINAMAAEVGLSANAWAAFTLGNAARSQEALRARLTDETASIMNKVINEGLRDEYGE